MDRRGFLWNYTLCEDHREIAMEVFTASELEMRVRDLTESLEDRWGITVRLNQTTQNLPEPFDDGMDCVLGADTFTSYYILSQVRYFLGYFPSGLLTEIYAEYPDGDGLDLFIVRSIEGDPAAYANIWNTRPMVCFATEEFCVDQLPHEFAHILDIALFNSFERRDESFWDYWQNLNGDEDLYHYGEDWDWDDIHQAYFITGYAATNQQEDRAELFEYMFMSGAEEEEPYWLVEREHLREKAETLAFVLRQAYPSLNREDNEWERWLSFGRN